SRIVVPEHQILALGAGYAEEFSKVFAETVHACSATQEDPPAIAPATAQQTNGLRVAELQLDQIRRNAFHLRMQSAGVESFPLQHRPRRKWTAPAAAEAGPAACAGAEECLAYARPGALRIPLQSLSARFRSR